MSDSYTHTGEFVTVDEPIEYIDRSLPRASDWVRYEIQPGTYEVVTWLGYRKVQVQAREVESYYVNQLFTATSAHHSTEAKEVGLLTVPAWAVEKV